MKNVNFRVLKEIYDFEKAPKNKKFVDKDFISLLRADTHCIYDGTCKK